MKRAPLLAVIGIITLSSLTSCYKNYTCSCVSQNAAGVKIDSTRTQISSISKANAEKDCKALDKFSSSVTTYCGLEAY
jgi:tRNA A37 threonylcarbamoyladenosine dehydratase